MHEVLVVVGVCDMAEVASLRKNQIGKVLEA
jgi:hypothetical protein